MKDIESTTNHDVKAVEYYIKEQFKDNAELLAVNEYVHFACTSEDINNLAHGLMLKQGLEQVMLPAMQDVLSQIKHKKFAALPMLARTHGQTASPTTLGKEFANVNYRIERQMTLLKEVPHAAKFGGATGNFNAHHVAYPEIDWHQFAHQYLLSNLV